MNEALFRADLEEEFRLGERKRAGDGGFDGLHVPGGPGDILAAQEAIEGKSRTGQMWSSMVPGADPKEPEDLEWWQRALSGVAALPFVPSIIKGVGRAGDLGRAGAGATKAAKEG